jgi:hypothetical protein
VPATQSRDAIVPLSKNAGFLFAALLLAPASAHASITHDVVNFLGLAPDSAPVTQPAAAPEPQPEPEPESPTYNLLKAVRGLIKNAKLKEEDYLKAGAMDPVRADAWHGVGELHRKQVYMCMHVYIHTV